MTSPTRPRGAPLWSRRSVLVLGAATLMVAVLGGLERMALQDRVHFFAMAARLMPASSRRSGCARCSARRVSRQ